MSRMVLGTQATGALGLRTSASGFDAFTAADDGVSITFDSSWTNIAKLNSIGIASTIGQANSGLTLFSVVGSYPNLGYKPFIEVRRLVGSVVFDDFWDAANKAGSYTLIGAGGFSNSAGQGLTNNGYQALFAAYQIPVPTQ